MSWTGKILRVDLTDGEIRTDPTSKYAKDYLGGTGIGTRLFYDEVGPEVHGHDPENLLTFNTGPLTGTLFGTKLNIMTKSPRITNSPLVTASMGGQFANEMKWAGYDHIAIKGRAEEPVYLYIHDDTVEIRSAKHLWGTGTQGFQESLKEELNEPDLKIACIGQAGENMVTIALIIHDIQNAASHGGVGSVMGSKNLKAVAVRGTKGVKPADPEKAKELWDKYYRYMTIDGDCKLSNKYIQRDQLTTHSDMYAGEDLFATGYGSETNWVQNPKKEQLLGVFDEKYRVGSIGCGFCPVQCQGNYSVPGIGNGGAACYANCCMRTAVKNYDNDLWWEAIVKMQDYGVEVVEITFFASWLMFLYEKGIITAKDTDGIPMEWGSRDAIMAVMDKVCNREGFGELFADGLIQAAEKIADGQGLNHAMQDRNIQIPQEIPERGIMLGGSGALHMTMMSTQFLFIHPPVDRHASYQSLLMEGGYTVEEAKQAYDDYASKWSKKVTGYADAWRPDVVKGKAKYYYEQENVISITDMTGVCDWQSARLAHLGYHRDLDDISKELTAMTGSLHTPESLEVFARRQRLLQIAYNTLCQEIIGDVAPISPELLEFHETPIKNGKWKGQVWDQEKSEEAGEEYCELRGCDPDTGIPTPEALESLGLKDVAARLEEYDL